MLVKKYVYTICWTETLCVLYGSRVKGEKWAGEAPDIRSPADPEHATSFQLWNSQQHNSLFLSQQSHSPARDEGFFLFSIYYPSTVSLSANAEWT
jgi:hypothetical protein